ncbi:MAG: ABC transporter ATP-binding protein [Verrucomicrobia bacterium]|nr:ABC transporter ATP-binding protein [Verrucomicrobiota bacterium]
MTSVGIQIEGVTKSFGDVVAVDNVTLTINAGDLFFLLGPSGCGKTTILRMIAGFETPTAGRVYFDNRDMRDVPAFKRNTGMVFQSYALWPHMTVAQNVAYGLEERHVPKAERTERVAEALKKVQMDGYGGRMANQLSGGQQQRVALARALVIEPGVILMDEPLSNLDARLRLQMRHEIRRLHDDTGITMVYVTHDQEEALSMADDIAVMSMGRIEQQGAPRTIYRSPASTFVADFIGETNLLAGTLLHRDEASGQVQTPLGIFRARLYDDSLQAGAAVCCMIRPECLQLRAPEQENAFAAQMQRSMYLGEFEQFELQTEAGVIRAVCANPDDDMPGPGSAIRVGFAADDAVILTPPVDGA